MIHKIYKLKVEITMGYRQAHELKKYLNNKYGAYATIEAVPNSIFKK